MLGAWLCYLRQDGMRPKGRLPMASETAGQLKVNAQAAIRAGYAKGASAEVTASRLLRNPKVAAEIEKARGRLIRRNEISQDRLLRELANIAFFNLFECFDEKGALLPLSRMPKRAHQAIATVRFRDGEPSGLRLHDKLPALKMLADHLGLLKRPLNAPSAPPAEEEERLSVEEFRQRAAAEREGKAPSPDEG